MSSPQRINVNMELVDFARLLNYINDLDEPLPSELDLLKTILNTKLDKLVEHDLFTEYKTAATPEQRQEARRKYLDFKDIPHR